MGRNKFSVKEIKIIRMLLGKKCAGTRFQQKQIRHQLRTNFEFSISDFGEQGKAFGPEELDRCIEHRVIQILDDATIAAMKAKRERDKLRDDPTAYLQVSFTLSPCTEELQDIACALLGEQGYDSFAYTEQGIDAYVLAKDFIVPEGDDALTIDGVDITWTSQVMEKKDWNEEWEQNSFDPVLEREYGIKLNPQNAFGSGSHATTYQLVSLIMERDFGGQTVLDMGCGTGVLGIAMAKQGAEHVVLIDIELDSVNNSYINIYSNEVQNQCEVVQGDASMLVNYQHFGTIIANIHKNIILGDLETYLAHLAVGGTIILSGFFTDDVPDMRAAVEAHGLTVEEVRSKDDWAVVIARK